MELLAPEVTLARPGGELAWLLAGQRMTVGRSPTCDVVIDDPLVSRLHVTLERVGGTWTASDDGLSRNGTYVNGRRLSGRVALRDRDQLRLGSTVLVVRAPGHAPEEPTMTGVPLRAASRVTAAQRAVLVALARPVQGPYDMPASNAAIAEELCLSVEAVKTHLRVLYRAFGLEDLPQSVKRLRLVERADECGLLPARG